MGMMANKTINKAKHKIQTIIFENSTAENILETL
jgi:hypothetical protein